MKSDKGMQCSTPTSHKRRIKMKYFLSIIILILFTTSALAAQVNLAWEPSPTETVAGYVLYYGQNAQEFDFRKNVGNVLTTTVDGLGKGTWYFAVTAYNEIEESDFSNIVDFTEVGFQVVDVVHDPLVKPSKVIVTIEVK